MGEQIPLEDLVCISIIGSLCVAVRQPEHARARNYLTTFMSRNLEAFVDTTERLLQEDLITAIDILCDAMSIVVDVDLDNLTVVKTPTEAQFDKLITSRSIAVALTVRCLHTISVISSQNVHIRRL